MRRKEFNKSTQRIYNIVPSIGSNTRDDLIVWSQSSKSVQAIKIS